MPWLKTDEVIDIYAIVKVMERRNWCGRWILARRGKVDTRLMKLTASQAARNRFLMIASGLLRSTKRRRKTSCAYTGVHVCKLCKSSNRLRR